MKVLHMNTLLQGGAALCATRIAKALQMQGVECAFLTTSSTPCDHEFPITAVERDKDFWYSNPITAKVKHLLNRMPWYWDTEKMEIRIANIVKGLITPPYVHSPFSYYKNIAYHPLIEWADVIHLHWVSGMVDYPTFFSEVKKPIVWTMHDKFPLEGLSHYSSDFFALPQELCSLDKKCKKIKEKSLRTAKDLHMVAIANMMLDLSAESDVVRGIPVSLIHNGVDVNVFKPYPKDEIRKHLNIATDAKVFMYSGFNIHDRNKGLDRIVEALEKIDYPKKLLLCIGNKESELPETSFPIIVTGYVDNYAELSRYYSCADFFIQASYEETFAQTPLEAMACGTPVISTPCCGASDLIHIFNGVLCDGYNADSIAGAISAALQNCYDSTVIREYIVKNYDYALIAKNYIRLYETILQ